MSLAATVTRDAASAERRRRRRVADSWHVRAARARRAAHPAIAPAALVRCKRVLWQHARRAAVLASLVFLFAVEPVSPTASRPASGRFPGPAAVLEQAGSLWADHKAERAKADAFYERQEKRNAERLRGGSDGRRSRCASTPASRPTSTRSSPA